MARSATARPIRDGNTEDTEKLNLTTKDFGEYSYKLLHSLQRIALSQGEQTFAHLISFPMAEAHRLRSLPIESDARKNINSAMAKVPAG